MAEYTVQVNELIIHTIAVEADNEEDAREKGISVYLESPDTEYDSESEGIQSVYIYELGN
jgi:hypothetical protein